MRDRLMVSAVAVANGQADRVREAVTSALSPEIVTDATLGEIEVQHLSVYVMRHEEPVYVPCSRCRARRVPVTGDGRCWPCTEHWIREQLPLAEEYEMSPLAVKMVKACLSRIGLLEARLRSGG